MKKTRLILALSVLLLLLAACSGGGAQTEPTVESAAAPDVETPSPTDTAEATDPPATVPPATVSPATVTVELATTTPSPAPATTATDEPSTETPIPTKEVLAPSITVFDQEVSDGAVTIDEAVLADGGWMVIHLDVYGDPGPVVGFAPLEPGANEDVVVEIDVTRASPTLMAMLHEDTGTIGVYEFPDADPPVMIDGEMVIQPFAVAAARAATEEAMPVDLVEVAIQGFNFEPGDVTIPVGTTVRWTNMGSGSHTVTADDGSFASDTLSNGGTFEFTFNNPGTYLYYCEFHGGPGGEGMSAVITVTD